MWAVMMSVLIVWAFVALFAIVWLIIFTIKKSGADVGFRLTMPGCGRVTIILFIYIVIFFIAV
jgi:hypothetical protein